MCSIYAFSGHSFLTKQLIHINGVIPLLPHPPTPLAPSSPLFSSSLKRPFHQGWPSSNMKGRTMGSYFRGV